MYLEKWTVECCRKESVYLNKKKFIKAKKWGDWRSRPPKISYCKKWLKS
jgi:hypothetical protein